MSERATDKRLAVLLCFLFHGSLRISEALALSRGDVNRKSDHIELCIRRAKCDQEGKGSNVVIAVGQGQCSPGELFDRYTATFCAVLPSASDPFFPSFCGTASTNRLWTYDCAANCFKKLLAVCKIPGKITFHSLRAGGISAAANSGIQDSLLIQHGRWKNGQVMIDHYLTPSLRRKLSVSRATF